MCVLWCVFVAGCCGELLLSWMGVVVCGGWRVFFQSRIIEIKGNFTWY